jgi:hypothetical protein
MGQYTEDEYWRYLGMVQNGEGDISGINVGHNGARVDSE